MPERSARDETLLANDCSRGAGTQTRSAKALDGSQGAEPDLLQALEEQVRKPETTMKPEAQRSVLIFSSFELRISFGFRPSDFVIVNHASVN